MAENKRGLASGNKYLADPENWVTGHADYLFAFAFSRLNNEEQAKDLVQETFLAALERIKDFEGKSSERTWLTAILRNKIVDVYRKKSSVFTNVTDALKEEETQESFFNKVDGHWNQEHNPKEFIKSADDPLLSKEFQSILQKCLNKLPSLWLSVFTMKHIDESATEQICSELKVSPANFWVIIHRTKVNLRACLQKNWS